MGNLWLKIKVWTKITVACLLALYLLIFILNNAGEKVKFWWWFRHEYNGSMLYLVFFAFLIGGLVAILATTTFRTVRQVRELRGRNRSQKLEREISEMKSKAAMLQTKGSARSAGAADVMEVASPERTDPDRSSLSDSSAKADEPI